MNRSLAQRLTTCPAGLPAVVRRIGRHQSARSSEGCVKTIANSLFVFAALLTLPGIASAAVLIVNCNTVSSPAELSASLTCQRFNVATATLQSIEITVKGPVSGAISGQLGLTNNASTSQIGSASTASQFNVGALAGFSNINPLFTASYGTGSQTLAAGQSATYSGLTGNGSGSLGTATTSLGGYTGAGNFLIPVSTVTSYSFSVSGGNFASSQATTAAATAVVTYTYFAVPTLATQASPTVVIGGSISDLATLTGATNPTGAITFTLFGPNNASCAGAPIFSSTNAVNGSAVATSGTFTPTQAGTYRWIASYPGDPNNGAVAGACNDANETTVVNKASPTIATTASASVAVGNNISDSATLAAGFGSTGAITFTLYGPNNPTCTGGGIFTSTKPVSGNGVYASDPFTTTQAGTYLWIASYGGDVNNDAVAGACGNPGESVIVQRASPVVTTSATPAFGPLSGASLSDTATLAAGFNPTGTIVFSLYGPNDATCSGPPAFTSAAIPVNGNGTYASGTFTPTAAGTYYWIARFSGDANNNPATHACALPLETTTLTALIPTLGPLGLLLLVLGLAAAGGLAMRRIQ